MSDARERLTPSQRAYAASLAVASRLRAADAPPFIGQMPLTPHERTAALRLFEQSADPFATLCMLIERQSPLALALIAGDVALQDDPNLHEVSVYPLIDRLLGKNVAPLSNSQRDELVAAFRRACIRLGLTVQVDRRPSDRQWRVRELILQGGARRAHVRRLAEVFLSAERAFGLPDPADTIECVRFADFAAARLDNHPRLRVILENDQTGWHAAVYARLRRNEASDASPLAVELARHIAELKTQSPDRIHRPDLVLRGLDLCVTSVDGGQLSIDNGDPLTLQPGSELPLPMPWPANLRFQTQGIGWSQFANWLGTDDVCAVFDAERGGFLGTLRPGGQLIVRPGAVAVVSRCRFGIEGLDTDQFLGGINMAWVSVEADVQVDFSIASSGLIRPRPDRRITLGPVMAQDSTGALLFGSAITAAVSVPGELGAELTADLVIRHPAVAAGEVRTPIQLDATGQASVNIGDLLPKAGPFGRLRVMLTLSGELRTLVSTSAWHWPGLRYFDRARFHGPVPPNLIESDCKNIQRDAEGLTVVCAGDRPDALLRFDADVLHLTAPGIYASVERAGQPAALAVPIHAGSDITLGGNLANTLRLTCDNPDAILTIGDHVEPCAFARSNVRRIGFASLMTALEACEGNVTIYYRGSWDAPHTVCKLTRAETPTRFEVIRRVDYTEVVLASGNPIGSVRLDCSELLTGRRTEIDIPIDGESGATSHHLRLEPGHFSDGVWLVEPYCRLEGMAGTRPLRSAVGERCDVALHVNAGIFVNRRDPFLIEDPDAAYRRAARILSRPVVEASAATGFVGEVYRAAGKRLIECGDGAQLFAAELTGEMSAVDLPGYVPPLSPWDIDLHAFSAPAVAYDAALSESGAMAAFAGLGLIGRARMVKDVFSHGRFELSTAMAFENAASANRVAGLDLTDFSFNILSTIFSASNGALEDEPLLLSRGFFQRAAEHARTSLAEAYANPANAKRTNAAYFIARQARRATNGLRAEASRLGVGASAHWVPFVALSTTDYEMPDDLLGFLSALALAARLDLRGCDQVARFFDAIRTVCESDGELMETRTAAGICTRIGSQFFAAHLLLWEILLRSREA